MLARQAEGSGAAVVTHWLQGFGCGVLSMLMLLAVAIASGIGGDGP